MNLKIQHRNFDIPQNVQRLIEKKAQKVQKMLPTFSNDALDLHVTLEKLPRGSQYGASVVLTIPQTAIRVEEMADNPTGSIQASFDELLRKIKKFKSQLNREKFWQRQPETTPRIRTESVREFENLINENLDKIHNYVRRELFHKALAHNIPPGILQPEAVVDEVFLLITSHVKAKPGDLSLEQWMYQVAREQIDRRLDSIDRESARIEESTSQGKPHWEDEALNFYQPDESLKLEDVLSDRTGGNPELLMEVEETEQELHKAIARLPRKIRESFVLCILEGFDPVEVAMITGKDAEKVQKDVEDARRRLREQFHVA
ncbi:MAG: sigma-70 family RNA polymerase sigma factor [Acidobacteria bacterium]|nr:MAG: sigma-70 family RNA polymerase sigma factor [Acidobacteriota bacterium]